MLQIKNGAIKATLNRNRREAAVPAATWRCEEEEKAVCRGEARTGAGGGGGQGRKGGTGGRSQTDRDTKLLYCWMFRLRISEHGPRTRSNLGRSSFTHFRGPRATTVAARGRFIRSAISPGEGRDTGR